MSVTFSRPLDVHYMWDNGPLLDVSVLVTYEELFRLRVFISLSNDRG